MRPAAASCGRAIAPRSVTYSPKIPRGNERFLIPPALLPSAINIQSHHRSQQLHRFQQIRQPLDRVQAPDEPHRVRSARPPVPPPMAKIPPARWRWERSPSALCGTPDQSCITWATDSLGTTYRIGRSLRRPAPTNRHRGRGTVVWMH